MKLLKIFSSVTIWC